jgi:outer membrane protein
MTDSHSLTEAVRRSAFITAGHRSNALPLFMKNLSIRSLWRGALLGVALIGSATAEPWTLERAIPFALENSPDARVAEYRIHAARAGLEQARSAFWPQVQIRSSYIRTDNPMQVFGAALSQQSFDPALDFNNVPDADHLNVHGLVTVPLYAGGRITSEQRSARAQSEAARLQAEAVRNALAFEVSRAFYTIRKTREFIRATQAAVDAFLASLGIANHRLEAGTLLKHEVLDVEVRLAQAREDLARARNAHALALRAFRNLLGLESESIEISETGSTLQLPPDDVPAQRLELLAARRQTLAAEADVRRARSGRLPQVQAFGRYDYDHGWKFDGSGDSYTVGLQAQWDIWNGHRTRGQIKEAQAHLNTAQELERRWLLALDLEFEQARLSLEETSERLAVTRQSVDQADESAALTRARFDQGLALASQIIDAEAALTGARVRRAEAEADHQIAIAALRKALGIPQL